MIVDRSGGKLMPLAAQKIEAAHSRRSVDVIHLKCNNCGQLLHVRGHSFVAACVD